MFIKVVINVSRPREVAIKAKRVVSGKIEFLFENEKHDTIENQQFLVISFDSW